MKTCSAASDEKVAIMTGLHWNKFVLLPSHAVLLGCDCRIQNAVLTLCPLIGTCQNGYSTLQWRHNEPDGISYHKRRDCLLNRLFRRRSKETPKLGVTDLREGHKGPITRKMFPFDDVIMKLHSRRYHINKMISVINFTFRRLDKLSVRTGIMRQSPKPVKYALWNTRLMGTRQVTIALHNQIRGPFPWSFSAREY